MFFSIVLISIFTGTVATLLTIEHLGTQPHGFEDLGRARIVSVKGSAAAQLLEARQLTAQLVPGLDEAIATLRADGADALVFDRALFAEGVKAIPQARITILPTTLRPEFHAIAIHPTEPIVARTLDSPRWGRWRYEYLGQTDDRAPNYRPLIRLGNFYTLVGKDLRLVRPGDACSHRGFPQ